MSFSITRPYYYGVSRPPVTKFGSDFDPFDSDLPSADPFDNDEDPLRGVNFAQLLAEQAELTAQMNEQREREGRELPGG